MSKIVRKADEVPADLGKLLRPWYGEGKGGYGSKPMTNEKGQTLRHDPTEKNWGEADPELGDSANRSNFSKDFVANAVRGFPEELASYYDGESSNLKPKLLSLMADNLANAGKSLAEFMPKSLGFSDVAEFKRALETIKNPEAKQFVKSTYGSEVGTASTASSVRRRTFARHMRSLRVSKLI